MLASLFLVQYDVINLWQFKKVVTANNLEKYGVDVDQYMLLACTCKSNFRMLSVQLLDLSAYAVVVLLLIHKKKKKKQNVGEKRLICTQLWGRKYSKIKEQVLCKCNFIHRIVISKAANESNQTLQMKVEFNNGP